MNRTLPASLIGVTCLTSEDRAGPRGALLGISNFLFQGSHCKLIMEPGLESGPLV